MPKPKAGTKPVSASLPITPAESTSRAKSPTLVKRIMDEADRLCLDPRVSTALGRLFHEGVISESECEAGFRYADDVGRYERAKGRPRRAAKSASYDAGFGDSSVDLDVLHRMDPEAAEKLEDKIKRRVRKAEKRYLRCQVVIGAELVDPADEFERPSVRFTRRPQIINASVLDEVCCNNLPVHSIHYPAIKSMLRRLADVIYVLKDSGEAAAESKKRRIKPGDHKALAEATIDKLEAWFEKRHGKVRYFRLEKLAPWTPKRGIAVFGSNDKGELAHAMHASGKGIVAAVLDAALLSAALAKGWAEAPQNYQVTATADDLKESIGKLRRKA